MKRFFAKDHEGRKIYMAETDKVSQNREAMDQLLLLIGDYMEWNGDISHVFVSNESQLSDFGLDDAEVKQLSDRLEFTVTQQDYLVDIAIRMKPY
jgi:hypothetical protein